MSTQPKQSPKHSFITQETKSYYILLAAVIAFIAQQNLIALGLILLAILSFAAKEKSRVLAPLPVEYSGYAGFWLRFMSLFLDSGLFFAFVALGYLVFGKKSFDLSDGGIGISTFYTIIQFALLKKYGQSFGKMIMNLQIIRTDFSTIGWKEIFLRNIVDVIYYLAYYTKILLVLVGFMNLDFSLSKTVDPNGSWTDILQLGAQNYQNLINIWTFGELLVLLTNQRKRALHDFIAGTLVVKRVEPTKHGKYIWPLMLLAVLSAAFYIHQYKQNKLYVDLLSARDGEATRIRWVGEDYLKGTADGPKDYTQAYSWLQKAAAKNDARAQYYLGDMAEKGDLGKPDLAQALKWYRLAAGNGNRLAKNALERLSGGK